MNILTSKSPVLASRNYVAARPAPSATHTEASTPGDSFTASQPVPMTGARFFSTVALGAGVAVAGNLAVHGFSPAALSSSVAIASSIYGGVAGAAICAFSEAGNTTKRTALTAAGLGGGIALVNCIAGGGAEAAGAAIASPLAAGVVGYFGMMISDVGAPSSLGG